jgi:hypothetical protein
LRAPEDGVILGTSMEAGDGKIEQVLEAEQQQSLVLHYQRPYSWRNAERKTSDQPKPHFASPPCVLR